SATEVTDQTEPGDAVVHLSARGHNTGERRGVAVPQMYVSRPGSQVVRPPRVLPALTRTELAPAQRTPVYATLTRRGPPHSHTAPHSWQVEPGEVVLHLAASSRDLPQQVSTRVEAPALPAALNRYSTIGEWLDHPQAGPAVLRELGQFGQMFTAAAP